MLGSGSGSGLGLGLRLGLGLGVRVEPPLVYRRREAERLARARQRRDDGFDVLLGLGLASGLGLGLGSGLGLGLGLDDGLDESSHRSIVERSILILLIQRPPEPRVRFRYQACSQTIHPVACLAQEFLSSKIVSLCYHCFMVAESWFSSQSSLS